MQAILMLQRVPFQLKCGKTPSLGACSGNWTFFTETNWTTVTYLRGRHWAMPSHLAPSEFLAFTV